MVIPLRWLHLTMQGIGFTDEVAPNDVAEIVRVARERLVTHRPVTFEVGAPIVDPEAIMFRVQPADDLRLARDDIRAAIAEVWGPDQVPDSPEWAPHVSIAYSNADGPAAPYVDALASVAPEPVTVTLNAVQLIRLDRDTRVYRWDTEASVPLGADSH